MTTGGGVSELYEVAEGGLVVEIRCGPKASKESANPADYKRAVLSFDGAGRSGDERR